LVAIVGTGVCFSPAEVAASGAIAPEFRAAILLRAMAYERRFASTKGDVQLVVVGGAEGASAADAVAMEKAFGALASKLLIAGRKLFVKRITHNNPAETLKKLELLQANIVYAATGLRESFAQWGLSLGREGRILTCTEASGVGKGCLMAVEKSGERARIVLHLGLATESGFKFDPRLLRLSRVVQ
jgi:hypothetical protein